MQVLAPLGHDKRIESVNDRSPSVVGVDVDDTATRPSESVSAVVRIHKRGLPDSHKWSKFGPVSRSENGSVVLQVAEDIVPIGELKAHLSERIRDLRGRRRPLVVTQNGKATAVLLSPEEFDRLTSQARFVAAVQEGLDHADAGKVVEHDEVGKILDERFGTLAQEK
jgi:prevent-host-death family protein